MNDSYEQGSRERSPEERRSLAVMIAGGITAVLFVVWAVFFFVLKDDEPAIVAPDETVPAAELSGVEPLREAFGSFREVLNETAAAFGELQRSAAQSSTTSTTTSHATSSIDE